MSQFKNRIVEIRVMRAHELLDNEGNWRTHPLAQRETLEGVLHEIGKADVLLAYYSARNENKLTLLDGHLRKALDPDEEWTVAITDLNNEEADKLLLVHDPLAAMAEMDGRRVLALAETVNTDDLAVRELLRKMELEAQHVLDDENEEAEGEGKTEKTGPAAMEIMPFEHYDYVLLMFRNELDWLAAVETLGLERRADQRKTKKIGLCRVIEGKLVIERIQQLEFSVANSAKGAIKDTATKPAKEEPTDETNEFNSHYRAEPQTRRDDREPNVETVSRRARDRGRTRDGRLQKRHAKSRASSAA